MTESSIETKEVEFPDLLWCAEGEVTAVSMVVRTQPNVIGFVKLNLHDWSRGFIWIKFTLQRKGGACLIPTRHMILLTPVGCTCTCHGIPVRFRI